MNTDLHHDDLSAFLDGELPAARAAEVERSLASQPALRAELERLRATRADVGRLHRTRAPKGVFDAIMDAVDDDAQLQARRNRWQRPFGIPLQGLAIAAVTLLVLWTALPTPDSAPEPEAAAEPAPQVGFTPEAPVLYKVPEGLVLTVSAGVPAGRVESVIDSDVQISPPGGEVELELPASGVAELRDRLAQLGDVVSVGRIIPTRGTVTIGITVVWAEP